MHKLPDTAPGVYQAFVAGKFVVKRTHGKFSAVGADMALEQTINRSQKSASGIIGNTRKKNSWQGGNSSIMKCWLQATYSGN